MKCSDVQSLIRAHYQSEEDFLNVVDRIIAAEMRVGREISANKIRTTLNQCSDKKRDGYTVKPLHELTVLNKEKNNMVEIRQSDITLNDVIAPAETINLVQEVINEFKNRNLLAPYGLEVLTWTAMAIAGELNMDLVFVRWDSLISSYLGNTGSNIRKVFEIAAQRPIVLFLDEFDSIGKERGGKQEVGEMSRVVINLLQNIDMFPSESFLMAATNHGHLFDTAIWRRFSVVEMSLPEDNERQRLIKYYSKGLPINLGDMSTWLDDTQGMSGAEIKTTLHKHAKRQILNLRVQKLQSL